MEITPLTSRIGAEVTGIELGGDIGSDAVDQVRKALLEYKVLFFRDQHELTPGRHVAFGRLFGELEEHPFSPSPAEHPEIMVLERNTERDRDGLPYGENTWHSDVSWRATPSYGSILRAIEVPAQGGDTLWADMGAAYRGLSPALQAAIAPLRGVHDFSKSLGIGLPAETLAGMREKFPPVEHPVVRTHPETGEKLLYVGESFTTHLAGVDRKESDALLKLLWAQATKAEYQCRLSWRPGTVAFWDNRATQHYACNDIGQATRRMHRVTVVGDQPF